MAALANISMPVESSAETYILAGVTVLVIIASVWLFFWQRYKALLTRRTADVEREHADQLRAESERRAAAEGRLLRIPELERALLVSESKLREHADEVSQQRIRAAELETALATERHAYAVQGTQSEQTRTAMAETFRTLAQEALRGNAEAFATAATPLLQRHEAGFAQGGQAMVEALRPVAELVGQMQARLGEMERARTGAYDALSAQVRELSETQQGLRFEAANLAKALGAPGQRGRWGEIQLRRAIELAGMHPHADFIEPTSAGENGATDRPRPDVVVRLPGGRNLVIDAQAPVADYLDSLGALTHEERNAKLHAHALALREHVEALGSRAYWEQFQPAPEFVVLYLPGEAFFSAALDTDPALVEFGVEKRVLVATPTTLIALLRAVHYGWRQDAQVREARELTAIGADLHERLAQLGDRLASAGRALGSTVEQYNEAMASFSSHILPAARILRDHLPAEAKAAADAPPLSAPPLVERLAQPAAAEELRPPPRPVAATNHAEGNAVASSLPAPPLAPVLNPARPAGATGIRARVATPLRGVSPTIPPPPLG